MAKNGRKDLRGPKNQARILLISSPLSCRRLMDHNFLVFIDNTTLKIRLEIEVFNLSLFTFRIPSPSTHRYTRGF